MLLTEPPSVLACAPSPRVEIPPARIVIVADEAPAPHILISSLTAAGYAPLVVTFGAAALRAVRAHAPDLVVLDLLRPGGDGLALCRAIRAECGVPLLVLSAMNDVPLQVALFDGGVDDYLVQPVDGKLLLARIRRALARSAAAVAPPPAIFQIGDVQIDTARCQVWRGRQQILLTPSEWALLVALAQAQGRVVSYQELSAAIWPQAVLRGAELIHTLTKQVRQKLGACIALVNVRRVGYALRPPGDAA